MRIVNINGEICHIVETLEDVLSYNKEFDFVEEYGDYYYIKFKPESYYDESMYKVNKNTKEAEGIHIIDYFIECDGKAQRVNPSVLTI